MPRSGSSYIGALLRRQSPRRSAGVATAALGLMLAGCAGVGLPFEAASGASVDPTTTGSVNAKAGDPVDPSDWEAVRRTLASVPANQLDESDFAWSNPQTGSAGRITALAKSSKNCRTFTTTINDLRGIRGYRGEACRLDKGDWRLRGIVPDDSILL